MGRELEQINTHLSSQLVRKAYEKCLSKMKKHTVEITLLEIRIKQMDKKSEKLKEMLKICEKKNEIINIEEHDLLPVMNCFEELSKYIDEKHDFNRLTKTIRDMKRDIFLDKRKEQANIEVLKKKRIRVLGFLEIYSDMLRQLGIFFAVLFIILLFLLLRKRSYYYYYY